MHKVGPTLPFPSLPFTSLLFLCLGLSWPLLARLSLPTWPQLGSPNPPKSRQNGVKEAFPILTSFLHRFLMDFGGFGEPSWGQVGREYRAKTGQDKGRQGKRREGKGKEEEGKGLEGKGVEKCGIGPPSAGGWVVYPTLRGTPLPGPGPVRADPANTLPIPCQTLANTLPNACPRLFRRLDPILAPFWRLLGASMLMMVGAGTSIT